MRKYFGEYKYFQNAFWLSFGAAVGVFGVTRNIPEAILNFFWYILVQILGYIVICVSIKFWEWLHK